LLHLEGTQAAFTMAAADTTDLELYFTSQARRLPSGWLPQTLPMSMDILYAVCTHLSKSATAQHMQMFYRADRRAGAALAIRRAQPDQQEVGVHAGFYMLPRARASLPSSERVPGLLAPDV
jgi:hypothetical protein